MICNATDTQTMVTARKACRDSARLTHAFCWMADTHKPGVQRLISEAPWLRGRARGPSFFHFYLFHSWTCHHVTG
jgi:hypothetical protein